MLTLTADELTAFRLAFVATIRAGFNSCTAECNADDLIASLRARQTPPETAGTFTTPPDCTVCNRPFGGGDMVTSSADGFRHVSPCRSTPHDAFTPASDARGELGAWDMSSLGGHTYRRHGLKHGMYANALGRFKVYDLGADFPILDDRAEQGTFPDLLTAAQHAADHSPAAVERYTWEGQEAPANACQMCGGDGGAVHSYTPRPGIVASMFICPRCVLADRARLAALTPPRRECVADPTPADVCPKCSRIIVPGDGIYEGGALRHLDGCCTAPTRAEVEAAIPDQKEPALCIHGEPLYAGHCPDDPRKEMYETDPFKHLAWVVKGDSGKVIAAFANADDCRTFRESITIPARPLRVHPHVEAYDGTACADCQCNHGSAMKMLTEEKCICHESYAFKPHPWRKRPPVVETCADCGIAAQPGRPIVEDARGRKGHAVCPSPDQVAPVVEKPRVYSDTFLDDCARRANEETGYKWSDQDRRLTREALDRPDINGSKWSRAVRAHAAKLDEVGKAPPPVHVERDGERLADDLVSAWRNDKMEDYQPNHDRMQAAITAACAALRKGDGK